MSRILKNSRINTGTLEKVLSKHESWLDQPLKTSSDVLFASLIIQGDTNTNTLNVQDPIIYLNNRTVSLSSNNAGISIKRDSDSYFNIFYNEQDGLKAGVDQDIKSIVLRDNNPTDKSIFYWDGTEKILTSSSDLSFIDSTLNTPNLSLNSIKSKDTDNINLDSNVVLSGSLSINNENQNQTIPETGIYKNDDDLVVKNSNDIVFKTNNNEVLTINNSGNVSIGTQENNAKLNIESVPSNTAILSRSSQTNNSYYCAFSIGKNEDSYNNFKQIYYHTGDSSESNKVQYIWQGKADPVLSISADGRIDVKGNVYVDGNIFCSHLLTGYPQETTPPDQGGGGSGNSLEISYPIIIIYYNENISPNNIIVRNRRLVSYSSVEKSLSVLFEIQPTDSYNPTSFSFDIPGRIQPFQNKYDIIASINGYTEDETNLENCRIFAVQNETRSKITFTSTDNNQLHYIQIIVNYSI